MVACIQAQVLDPGIFLQQRPVQFIKRPPETLIASPVV